MALDVANQNHAIHDYGANRANHTNASNDESKNSVHDINNCILIVKS